MDAKLEQSAQEAVVHATWPTLLILPGLCAKVRSVAAKIDSVDNHVTKARRDPACWQ